MSKEVLTHSDRYVRKTNRIILIIGIIALVVFLFGLMLLNVDTTEEEKTYQIDTDINDETSEETVTDNDTNAEIVFDDAEEIERPITLEPSVIDMGKIVLGRSASGVLTIGTNSKAAIRIVSVELEDIPSEGFSFEEDCKGKELRGDTTCKVQIRWLPTVAANIQNNFKIIWHETNVSAANAKHSEVEVKGSAVTKEDCQFCDTGVNGPAGEHVEANKRVRYAVGPDGQVIGVIDDDGIVRDADGNIIGKVNANGLVMDKDGNIIGVASTGKLIFDENGKVIGYVDADGIARDMDGNVIGKMLADGTIVDENGNVIGKAVDYGYVYDDAGNIIGRVLPDGSVIDENGNVIGHLNENGEVVNEAGEVIGHTAKSGEVIFDDEGSAVGVVMPNGTVVNANGDVIGTLGKDGKVYASEVIGQRGAAVRLAVDEQGNVIGYIGDDGKVYDFAGNLIGQVDENGNIIDKEGNIIGKAGTDWVDLAVDKDGKPIGWIDKEGKVHQMNLIGRIDENGIAYDINGNPIGRVSDKDKSLIVDKDGNVIGRVDVNGNIYAGEKIIGIVDSDGVVRSYGVRVVGSMVDKNLLPITPEGKVLGVINNQGEIVKEQKVVGKMRPNGIVTNLTGDKVLAVGVQPGYIVNWGCDYSLTLDKDGVIRQDGKETKYRIFADGTVWSPDGKFMGKAIETGSIYDNECRYIGEVNADGYVRDTNRKEIGCLNPDGTVLDLEEPRVKGHLVKMKNVFSSDWQVLGRLEENGILRDKDQNIIGCANDYGEVYDRNMAYLGSVSDARYAFDFEGKLLGVFNDVGNIEIAGVKGAHQFLNRYVADANQEIVGFAAPYVSILVDATGKRIGHLFPDGYVYDDLGVIVDKINGGEQGFYSGSAAKFFDPKFVVDMTGRVIGRVNYDQNVIDNIGKSIGKINANGLIFDDKGQQIGGVVRQGSARGYNGVYLGYVVKNGDVVQLEETQDGDGKKYRKGEISGNVVPDGHVIKEKRIIGEVLPQDVMVDIMGDYVGFSNDRGLVVSGSGKYITTLLPGGSAINSIMQMQKGFVVDYSGKLIGTVLPTGVFMDNKRIISGKVLADGKVVNDEGRFIGEVVNGDIVIGNDDKVKGFVGFDGKVYFNGNVIGKVVTDGLATDKQNNVLGHVYSIGSTVLSSRGEFIGRLTANGKVIDNQNREVGYLKSNGSFIDKNKNVSGYVLPEVARNRRN